MIRTLRGLFNFRSSHFAAIAFVGLVAGLPASATLTYTCDPSITGAGFGCSYLNGTIAGLYTGTFSDVNANIYITFGNTGLGSSDTALNLISYASYKAALIADKSSADDITATGSLPASLAAPLSTGGVALSNANVRALPTLSQSGFAGFDSTGAFCMTLGVGSCLYDGYIAINGGAALWYRSGTQGGAYDFYAVVEHETNEVLGHGSCAFNNSGDVPGCTFNGSSYIHPLDLFRYHSNGTRSYLPGDNNSCADTNQANNACFSIDGGVTMVAAVSYNNVCAGTFCADGGDYSTNCTHVQDAYGCQGGGILDNTAAAEFRELDVIGYTFSTVPEPSTMAQFGAHC